MSLLLRLSVFSRFVYLCPSTRILSRVERSGFLLGIPPRFRARDWGVIRLLVRMNFRAFPSCANDITACSSEVKPLLVQAL